MTYPLIGNCGICSEDNESPQVHAHGIVVKDFCKQSSNNRSIMTLDTMLKKVASVYLSRFTAAPTRRKTAE